jgi:hypothetical protein
MALLGFILPVGCYIPVIHHFMSDNTVNWTEGGGHSVYILCISIILVSELAALWLGILSWRFAMGKAAVGIAVIILLLIGTGVYIDLNFNCGDHHGGICG